MSANSNIVDLTLDDSDDESDNNNNNNSLSQTNDNNNNNNDVVFNNHTNDVAAYANAADGEDNNDDDDDDSMSDDDNDCDIDALMMKYVGGSQTSLSPSRTTTGAVRSSDRRNGDGGGGASTNHYGGTGDYAVTATTTVTPAPTTGGIAGITSPQSTVDGFGDQSSMPTLQQPPPPQPKQWSEDDPMTELPEKALEFFSSVGIDTAEKLLSQKSADLRAHYGKWRKDQGMPERKEGSVCNTTQNWKERIRLYTRMELADNVLDCLPPSGRNFLAHLNITSPEEFVEYSEVFLSRKLLEYRASQNMPEWSNPMSQAESTVQSWLTNVRMGLRAKARQAKRRAAAAAIASEGGGGDHYDSIDPAFSSLNDSARQFLTDNNVTTARALIVCDYIELASKYISWRGEKGLPEIPESAARSQMQNWRTKVKRTINKSIRNGSSSNVGSNMNTTSTGGAYSASRQTGTYDPIEALENSAITSQFFPWVGIDSAAKLLSSSPKDFLVPQYAAWRKQNGLKELTAGSIEQAVAVWKTTVNRVVKMGKASDPVDVLPENYRNFFSSIGLTKAEDILNADVKYLVDELRTWRQQNNMAALSANSGETNISIWRTQLRHGLKAKATAANRVDDDDNGVVVHPSATVLDQPQLPPPVQPFQTVTRVDGFDLGPNANRFLSASGITTPEQILSYRTKELVGMYLTWRQQNGMNEIKYKSADWTIGQWRATSRKVINSRERSIDPFAVLTPRAKKFLAEQNILTAEHFLETSTDTLAEELTNQSKNRGGERTLVENTQIVSGWKTIVRESLLRATDKRGTGQNAVNAQAQQYQLDAEAANSPIAEHEVVEVSVDSLSKLDRIDQTFLSFAGINSVGDLLKSSSDTLGVLLSEWRHNLGLPLLDDPSQYIAGLQRSVRPSSEQGSPSSNDVSESHSVVQRRTASKSLSKQSDVQRIRPTPSKSAMRPGAPRKQAAVKSTSRRILAKSFSPYREDSQGPTPSLQSAQRNLVPYVDEAMVMVEGSSRKYQDPSTRLPVFEFSVHDTMNNDVEHDFRAYAAQSGIPGAGFGCFLTYLGRRVARNGTKTFDQNAPPFNLSPGRYIDLGIYGPYRDEDRKIWEHYEIKNFIFSHEPCGWAWDVSLEGVKIHRATQAIDITDDCTGMIHGQAKSSVLVYVNEADNEYLHRNIYSEEKDLSIHYHYKSDLSLRKDQTTELLINYKEQYEEVRERKGYGTKNKSGETKSDYDLASRFHRNFLERDEVRQILLPLGTKRLPELVEFLLPIRDSLATVVESFLQDSKGAQTPSHVPYARQIVALRRLDWLRHLIAKQFERLKKFGVATHEAIAGCEGSIRRLEWNEAKWKMLWEALSNAPNLADAEGVKLLQSFKDELMEEVFYSMKYVLPYPLDDATWCNVAIHLMRDLCSKIYERSLSSQISSDGTNYTQLMEFFKSRSLRAANQILSRTSLDDLAFDSKVWQRYTMENRYIVKDEPAGTKCLLQKSAPSPSSMPEPLLLTRSIRMGQVVDIHELWYTCRQVIVVLDAFGKSLPPEANAHEVTHDVMKELGIDEPTFSTFGFHIALGTGHTVYEKKAPFSRQDIEKSLDGWKLELDPSWPENAEDVAPMPIPAPTVKRTFVRKSSSSSFNNENEARASNSGTEKSPAPEKPPSRKRVRGPAEPPPGIQPNERHTPTEPLEGGWPEGWQRIFVQRMNDGTATKGRYDRYWFTPKKNFKLRSMTEVSTFISLLPECNGDEAEAKKRMKKSKTSPKRQCLPQGKPSAEPTATGTVQPPGHSDSTGATNVGDLTADDMTAAESTLSPEEGQIDQGGDMLATDSELVTMMQEVEGMLNGDDDPSPSLDHVATSDEEGTTEGNDESSKTAAV